MIDSLDDGFLLTRDDLEANDEYKEARRREHNKDLEARIGQKEEHIRRVRFWIWPAVSIGTASGFAAPWAIYGLLIWIGRGFAAKKENEG
jgi:hypothetical protein